MLKILTFILLSSFVVLCSSERFQLRQPFRPDEEEIPVINPDIQRHPEALILNARQPRDPDNPHHYDLIFPFTWIHDGERSEPVQARITKMELPRDNGKDLDWNGNVRPESRIVQPSMRALRRARRMRAQGGAEKDICLLPMSQGHGQSKEKRWYFNTKTWKCESFTYFGDGGNKNNFRLLMNCIGECTRPRPRYGPGADTRIKFRQVEGINPKHDICTMRQDPGPCGGAFRRWSYDFQLAECVEFTYSGCGGNENNFADLQTCKYVCENPLSNDRQDYIRGKHIKNALLAQSKGPNKCQARNSDGTPPWIHDYFYYSFNDGIN